MIASKRNSSFELLRLVLMFMIIVHHCIVHGAGLTLLETNQLPNLSFVKVQELSFINSFFLSGVNCFILISGFWGINISITKILKLLLSIVFYTLIFSTLYYLINDDFQDAIKSLFIIAQSKYWFVVDYLFLLPFTPLLNKFYNEFKYNYQFLFTLVLILLSCYYGFLWHNSVNFNGYTFFQFITLYCLGRFIRLNVKANIAIWKNILLFFTFCLLNGLLIYYFISIKEYTVAWHLTYYNNPLVILSSLSLLLIFRNIKIQSRVINWAAKSSFAIYLFQSSPMIGLGMYDYIKTSKILQGDIFVLMGMIIFFSLIALISAILIDQIQILFNNYLIKILKIKFKNIKYIKISC